MLSEGFGEVGGFEGEGKESWAAGRVFDGDAIAEEIQKERGKKELENLLKKEKKKF